MLITPALNTAFVNSHRVGMAAHVVYLTILFPVTESTQYWFTGKNLMSLKTECHLLAALLSILMQLHLSNSGLMKCPQSWQIAHNDQSHYGFSRLKILTRTYSGSKAKTMTQPLMADLSDENGREDDQSNV